MVAITVTNNSDRVGFFMRAEVTRGEDGEELLPITYDDNYITLFAHESRAFRATLNAVRLGEKKLYLRLEGYNVKKQIRAIE